MKYQVNSQYYLFKVITAYELQIRSDLFVIKGHRPLAVLVPTEPLNLLFRYASLCKIEISVRYVS